MEGGDEQLDLLNSQTNIDANDIIFGPFQTRQLTTRSDTVVLRQLSTKELPGPGGRHSFMVSSAPTILRPRV